MQLKDQCSYKAIIISPALAERRLPGDVHNRSTLKGRVLKLPYRWCFQFDFPVVQYSIRKTHTASNISIAGN